MRDSFDALLRVVDIGVSRHAEMERCFSAGAIPSDSRLAIKRGLRAGERVGDVI